MDNVSVQERSLEKSSEKERDNASLELGAVSNDDSVDANSLSVLHTEVDRAQRKLKQRHVQMIAIAGTLGTGLFLGSGKALQEGGPLGALLSYVLVGTVSYATLCSLGEMTAFAPVSGTIPYYASRWVDPAFGFTLGWNYYYTSAISVPAEITAAGILLTYWDTNSSHQPAYTAAILVCVCAINICGTRWFGEAEFLFCIIKIALIILLIISGLVVDLGGAPNHERVGFRYWKDPGMFARAGLESNIGVDRLLALFSVIVQAGYSFQGVEIVAITAAETESPRRNIRKAVKRVFWRILTFYILGILITGMVVPYNDSALLSDTGTAAQSPYVIAVTRAGISVLPSIINAAVFTSALSAANSSIYAASRILYGLALSRQAPHFLTYCTKSGLPVAAVLVTCAFTLLAFMNVSSGAETVFTWLQNLMTTTGFFCWGAMNVTYLRFYKGLKVQGIDRRRFSYYNRMQPFLAWWAIVWLVFFILITGYAVFWQFNASDFLTAYLSIPIFLVPYLVWKILKRTRAWRAKDMDFFTDIPTLAETEKPEVPPRNIWERLADVLF